MNESETSNSDGWKRQEQWVSCVLQFSSEYDNRTFSANQVIGPPKIYPRYGGIGGSWCQANTAENEFIVVEFERAVYPEQIDIYETFNPGAVIRVWGRNGKDKDNDWKAIWQTETPHVESLSRIFSITCPNMSCEDINQIRLDVNCHAAANWCAIDSIKLIGLPCHKDIIYKELIINFKQLFLNDYLIDVIFQLDNKQTISCHRNILSNRSIYFSQLFDEYSSTDQELIRIKNISYKAFYQIIHYIYTDTLDTVLNCETYLELMRKADEYYLNPIYNEALNALKKNINTTNVLKIFVESGLFTNDHQQDNIILDDIVDLCVEFIRNNRRDVYLSDEMQQLTKDMLLKLVQLVP